MKIQKFNENMNIEINSPYGLNFGEDLEYVGTSRQTMITY